MSMSQPLYTVVALQAMAQVLVPNARAQENGGSIDIDVGSRYVGRITLDDTDRWLCVAVKSKADYRKSSRMLYEERTGPFNTPAEAIRSMFGGPEAPSVKILPGICADDQVGNFQNATFQTAGDYLSFSIETKLQVPDNVANEGEAAAVRFMNEALTTASAAVPGLSFHVQIGPNETSDD